MLLQGLLHTTAAPAARSWHPEANVLSIGLGRVLNSSQLCRGRERSVASQPQFIAAQALQREEEFQQVFQLLTGLTLAWLLRGTNVTPVLQAT